MSDSIRLQTPLDDYALLDFGGGRRLERLGPYVVDRPDPRARGARARADWSADWVYAAVGAGGAWQPARPGLPEQWPVSVDGQRLNVRLGPGGDIGFDPAQAACWRWLNQRLEGCYHIQDLKVLNLFGGAGGVTDAALAAGALVTHVEPDAELLAQARGRIDSEDVRWVHEDAHAFADQVLREGAGYDLLVLRPCGRVRGPHGRAWDLSCDLNTLLPKLPRLISDQCRGVWLAPRETERGKAWNADVLAGLLREVFPGRRVAAADVVLVTEDGRELTAGAAAQWYDDDAGLDADGEQAALDAAALEERLDVYLDPVLSSRRTAAEPARQLARFPRADQDFVLRWVEVVSRSNGEMAYQFAARVARALELMARDEVEQWLLQAMDVFDTKGLHAGVASFAEVEAFAETMNARRTGVALDEAGATLELFVHGLSGRRLKLEPGPVCFTDSETLFLPELLNRYGDRADNARLYKVLAVQLWAQVWYGTLRPELQTVLAGHGDGEKAQRHLELLERLRLDARIARVLPGVARDQARLLQLEGQTAVPAGWEAEAARLAEAGATAEDSLALLAQVHERPLPEAVVYQVRLDPARAAQVRAARTARERDQFQALLRYLVRDKADLEPAGEAPPAAEPNFQAEVSRDEEGQAQAVELTIDGKPVAPPEEARALVSSILQDFGDIPPEYLVAAGDGGYKPDPRAGEERSDDVWKGTYHEEGAFLYNEWDFKRQHYRKNWCVLRETDVVTGPGDFVAATLRRHAGLVKNIRRVFEVLRGEEKLLKRQSYGDDVDIDALVEAFGDVKSGMEMTDRLFTRKHKLERNIAVMFMVDMSGSTKGWINDAERESLILLCEALESLGDRYAIYGFSGMTRKRCELYRVKSFDEPYNDTVKGRISGIGPRDYTRMGVTIRHLTHLLSEVDARTRLLVTISDGKPDDFDGYRGEYGIEDTRMALIEAKRAGIHPFCITIDREAHDYLPHMYGAVNYTVIDEVRKLPLRVSDIYRKLTT